MKRIFFILLFPLLIISGCFAKDNAAVKPTDEQEAINRGDPYTWDFGQVKEGELQKHTFILKNESEKTLNIQNVNTSCGCMVSKVENNTVAPGEEIPVAVTFNSKGYSGAVQQFVYVHTDNVDNQVIRFTIKAEVIK